MSSVISIHDFMISGFQDSGSLYQAKDIPLLISDPSLLPAAHPHTLHSLQRSRNLFEGYVGHREQFPSPHDNSLVLKKQPSCQKGKGAVILVFPVLLNLFHCVFLRQPEAIH